MEIRANPYRSAAQPAADASAQKPRAEGTTANETEKVPNTDTLTISIGEEKFTAQKTQSKTDMLSMKIREADFEKFRSTVLAMKSKSLGLVDWNSTVDPTGAIRDAYFIESTINQLNDPNGAKNVFERDKIANAYAQSKLDALIEQKKAVIASKPEDHLAKEHEEYQRAYDAYHSDDSSGIIAMLSGDERKAYDIYCAIISGGKYTVKDEEFLTLHNGTMFRAARLEFQQMQEKRLGNIQGKFE